MKAIAYAIFYKDYGRRFERNWLIYSPNMVPTKLVFKGLPDPYNPKIREMLQAIPYTERKVNNPKVFKYLEFSEVEAKNRTIYKFVFYEGFVVNAISM